MSTSNLEQLRIDRRAETPSRSPWKWLTPLLVVVLAAAGWWFWSSADGPIEVRTAVAREFESGSAAGAVLNSSGYVTARRQATVSSKFTGRVSEVLIEEGMTVEAGQVLARLDDGGRVPDRDIAERLHMRRNTFFQHMIRHLDTLRLVNLAQSLQELFVALRLIEFPGHQLAAVPQGIDNVHGQHDVIQRTLFQGGGAVTHAATASALPSSARRARPSFPSSGSRSSTNPREASRAYSSSRR